MASIGAALTWGSGARHLGVRLRAALLCLLVAFLLAPDRGAGQGHGCVLVTELSGIVNAGTASQLEDALASAERKRCAAMVITVDTPGGMLEETRQIVRGLLGARVPTIAYVTPRGARAGSAGVFIVMAAHVAAMAPGTVIGAAHPVTGTGQDPEKAGGEHLGEKIENDTAAFARTIAEERGRNVVWAEAAVRESVSATAREALEQHVIDYVEADLSGLLSRLDGQVVTVDGRSQTLALSTARLIEHGPTLQQRALSILGNPNLAYMLLILGILGIVVELQHPGVLIPGGIGLFCLLLAAIGLNLLPVNFGGLALLAVAAALLVAEMYITSFGLLSAAAVVCLLLGSALLIDTSAPQFFVEPDVRVTWSAVLPLAAVLAGGSFALAYAASRARRRPPSVGAEGIVGELGEVTAVVSQRSGKVFVHGERWGAVADGSIPVGARVRVIGLDGLTLKVVPAEEESV